MATYLHVSELVVVCVKDNSIVPTIDGNYLLEGVTDVPINLLVKRGEMSCSKMGKEIRVVNGIYKLQE